jgi:molybdopterin molybdotransferase
MKQIWHDIDLWLQKNINTIYLDLLNGAKEKDVLSFEKKTRLKLPDAFKSSLHIHDGQGGEAASLFGGWQLLSLKHILGEWQLMKRLFDEGKLNAPAKSPPTIKPVWWNTKWIPIAANNLGDLICIDLDPTDKGIVGQIIMFQHMDEQRKLLSNGFEQWLKQYLNDFSSGKFVVSGEQLIFKGNKE